MMECRCESCARKDCNERTKQEDLRIVILCDDFIQKNMTNGDRIRAMSDEILAEFIILSPEMEFDVCRCCKFGNPTQTDDRGQCLIEGGYCDAESRAEAFKKWLKQPMEDE